nr:reverse transcriptase domain-containing protein [Tanacetum cinerariifolium]
MNEINIKVMQTQINNVKNELRNEMKTSIQDPMSNQTNELKNIMASFFQMNIASTSGSRPLLSNTIANPKGELKAITTQSGLVLDGPFVPMPPPFINPEEDERVEKTLTNLELALLSNKEKLLELANTPLNENCSAIILKKLPKKLGDLGKFLIPCGFSKLKCKALADLGITGDVFVPIGKFTFFADFVTVDYESDPRVPLILGRPFLRTAHALIDEEKINESKHLIDELDLLKSSDFLPSPEYGSFLFEDFFKVDALPSTDNEDKLFNPADQDSLNSADGGNLLERRTQDVLTIIENKSKDNIQGYVAAAAVNYNQGNFGYRPLSVANQIRPSGFAQPNVQNNKNSFFQMNTTSTSGSGPLPSNIIANSKGELKAITTRSGLFLNGPFVPMPPLFINLEEDARAEETLTDPELTEYTIKVPSPLVQKAKPPSLRNYVVHQRDPRNLHIAYPSRMNQKKQEKDEIQIHNELKCKALTDLGASINLMPLSVLKKLGLPELISTRMTLELANRTICTPAGIAKDVFVPNGKFTFPADFVIVDYDSDPRVPLILGGPFLRTARALIDVHREEMILRDGDERLTLDMRHDTSSYSNQPHKESINMINIYNDSYEDCLKDLFAINHLSGNPTFSSQTDLTSPEGLDSILEYSVDEGNLADPNNDLVVTIPEIFIDEHTLDYSSPPLYDDVDDDLVELESDNDDVYDDPFDSKEDKIKESKHLIDELDPPRSSYFLPSLECDSVLYEDFSKVDVLPSTNNEDKGPSARGLSFRIAKLEISPYANGSKQNHLLETQPACDAYLLEQYNGFLALGWHLEETHVTWVHLEKKRIRLRTYTKSLEESFS